MNSAPFINGLLNPGFFFGGGELELLHFSVIWSLCIIWKKYKWHVPGIREMKDVEIQMQWVDVGLDFLL